MTQVQMPYSGLCDEIINIEEWSSSWTPVKIRKPERVNHLTLHRLDTPWRPQFEWCKKHFGWSDRGECDIVWCYKGEGWFEFQREEDAVMFALRWA